MSRQWFPFYPGDYLRDTAHLTAVEHGAYLLLMLHYYANGSIPLEDNSLFAISKMTAQEWRYHKQRVLAFFDPSTMHHKRIDQELEKAARAADVSIGKAKKAAAARWSSHNAPSNAPSNAPRINSKMHGARSHNAPSNAPSKNDDAPSNAYAMPPLPHSIINSSSGTTISAGSLACAPDGALREPAGDVPHPTRQELEAKYPDLLAKPKSFPPDHDPPDQRWQATPEPPPKPKPSPSLLRIELAKQLNRPVSDAEVEAYIATHTTD